MDVVGAEGGVTCSAGRGRSGLYVQHAARAGVEDAPDGREQRGRVAGHQLHAAPRNVHQDDVGHPRGTDAGGLPLGAPGGASPNGQSSLRVHGAAPALAVEQNIASGVQGCGAGRRRGRDPGDRQGRQRRELLRGAEEQLSGDEEPSGEVQRLEIRRPERAR